MKDTVSDRLTIAKKFGADVTFDVGTMSDVDLVTNVRGECSPDGADVGIEGCGYAGVVPLGVSMLRVGGRFVIGGLVNPGSNFEIDGNDVLRKWITLKGVHNYHPRHLIQAVDFVMSNRKRFPFSDIVDSKFSLEELDEAFVKAAERSVLRAAIVP